MKKKNRILLLAAPVLCLAGLAAQGRPVHDVVPAEPDAEESADAEEEAVYTITNPILREADEAWRDYRFAQAENRLAAFNKTRRKAGEEDCGIADDLQRKVAAARKALENVQKIVVIDSINVPSDLFFKAYKLPASAGRLLAPEEMPITSERDQAAMAFTSEGGDFMMWSRPDSVGILRLTESTRLVGGGWQHPQEEPDVLADGNDADFPFLTTDGTMLYFAADREDSLGGYDIYAATRDPQTGEYLAPLNMGMPFNSPDDDYMLAIDEEHGVGWWATERNHIPDHVTIYVYKLTDARDNLDPDDEELVARARISDYKDTWEEGEDYAELLETIAAIDPDAKTHEDFRLPMPGGEFYTVYEDFRSRQASDAMRRYVKTKESFDEKTARLEDMRRDFARQRSRALTKDIQALEEEVERDREALKRQLSEIYRLERNS